MIISRTPHRISFFGGGTDYPSWYLEHGGKVLGATIDKYCYIICRELPPYFGHKHQVVYSVIERVQDAEEIQHPSVRETMKFLKHKKGLEIHVHTDIPARSGMGSSSTFTVGLLKALHALEGKIISREDLFQEAIHIEQDLIGEHVGSQDQVHAACGGINTIEFLQSGRIVPRPVIMTEDRLRRFEAKFMLFFSGISRFASEIAKDQIGNTARNKGHLQKMHKLVDQAYGILTEPDRDLDDFGRLLNETWRYKKELSEKIATSEIEQMYEAAMAHGALGGKLLGAGGGGFMLFYVDEEHQARVRKSLGHYLHIPFTFDFTGAEIIVYRPDYRPHRSPHGGHRHDII